MSYIDKKIYDEYYQNHPRTGRSMQSHGDRCMNCKIEKRIITAMFKAAWKNNFLDWDFNKKRIVIPDDLEEKLDRLFKSEKDNI